MNKHILYILLLLCSSTLVAQNNAIFGGGTADGYDKDNYLQPLPSTVNFSGGNNDGYAKDCYTQNLPTSVSFSSGNGDGYTKDCYTQTPFLSVAFGGGNGDGYTKDCYTQASNLNNIFSGGIGGDGMLNGCANEPLGCFLTIALGNDTTFCDGATLTLNAGIFPGGATYLWQDSTTTTQTFIVDTTGLYYVYVVDTGGCVGIDSIMVTVNPQPIVNLGNDTVFCAGNNLVLDAENAGATYQWQNGVTAPFLNQTFTVNATGTYFVNAAFGICTASDTINVTVNPIVTTNLPDSIICNGDSALIFGSYETTAGTYRDTVLALTGCDSILVQQLIVNPTYNQNLNTITICNGDSALILGNFETVAGTYSDTLSTINGCDSIVNQTLIVSPNHIVNLGNDTAFCAGSNLILDASTGASSYQWMNGTGSVFTQQTFTVNATGTYFVVATLGACTSTDTIDVTVNPITTTNLPNAATCNGDSALIFGNYETIAGAYRDTLVAITGCDSILVQQLIVNPTYNQNLGTITICAGDSALIFGNYETVPGIYSDTLTSINSCDSIVSQTLSVLSNSSVNLGNDTTFCAGNSLTLDAGAGASSYQWMNGTGSAFTQQTFTVNTTGTYFVVVANGSCSASDTIDVTVNPTASTNLPNTSICDGDSTLIFGSFESIAGTYRDTLTTTGGCDSVLIQQLIVNPIYTTNLATSICNGDSILLGGSYQYLAAAYYDTLATTIGCDSIIATALSVNPTFNNNATTAICDGDSILLGGAYQNTAGTYADTLATVNGCDSIINTTLSILPIYNNTATAQICQGDSILLGGSYQYTAGAYTDVYTSSLGCDSTIVTTLTVNPTPINTLTVITICDNESVLIFGNIETTAGTYDSTIVNGSVNGCDSIIRQQLMVNPTYNVNQNQTICSGDSILLGGFYQNNAGTYYDTLQTSSSCDSLIVTQLSVINSQTTNRADTICEGESIFVGGAFQTTTGTYYDSLQTSAGCDSLVITDLLVSPKPTITVTATPSFIVGGQSSQLTATGGGTYLWSPSNSLSCVTCANPIAKPTETTIYTVQVDSNGCIVSDTVSITLDDEFFIPEGFSPNGDGINDVFEIVGLSNYPNAKITIINRWGSKVFEANPYQNNWNGSNYFGASIGDKLPAGTYFYILDLGRDNPEGSQEIKGYIYINN